ncbi:MAG: twin-arginine translocase subunit TatC [bacterium]
MENKTSFWDHLEELRKRIIISIVFVAIGATAGFYFAEDLLDLIEFPLRSRLHLSIHSPYISMITVAHPIKLVFIKPIEAIWTYLKLGLIAGLVITLPFVLYELWLFIKPGLYPNERKYVRIFVISGGLFFLIGGIFSFVIVLPFAIHFLLSVGGGNLLPMISVGEYVDFCLQLILSFGLIFELPFAILILVAIGIVTPKALAEKRRYAIVGAFILGAILSPSPDVFNQTLIAVPLILLYEIGILLSRIFVSRRKKETNKT